MRREKELEQVAEERPVVLGIGLPRTGTSSLAAALTMLGWRVLRDPFGTGRLRRWLAGDVELDPGYDAVVGEHGAACWRDLVERYPGARVICSVRQLDTWLESCAARLKVRPQTAEAVELERIAAAHGRNTMAVRLLCQLAGGGYTHRPRWLADLYHEHVDAIEAWSERTGRRVLWFDVCGGDGWHELCAYLGARQPFPHVEQRQLPEQP